MPKFALGSTQAINMSGQIWENTAKGDKDKYLDAV